MNKRSIENSRVKEAICMTYLDLLAHNTAREISISEITAHANVSRMAFYRNFSDKDDIVRYYFDLIGNEIRKELPSEFNFWSPEFGRSMLQIMKKYKDQILLLTDRGYLHMIMQMFNDSCFLLNGDMKATDISRYHLYFAAGAALDGTLAWMKDGCRESVDDFYDIIVAFLRDDMFSGRSILYSDIYGK